MRLPRLYAIADVGFLRGRGVGLREFAEGLRTAGVMLVQLRYKDGSPREVLDAAAVLKEAFAGSGALLVMNDRADLAVIAGFDGVHVGQGDLGVEDARRVVGAARIVGVSTHTEAQIRAADATSADYVAVGPVFGTSTKLDAEAVVGLDGVRMAHGLTGKALVGIGGITRENAGEVWAAGADSVAVISGLVQAGAAEELVRSGGRRGR